jgi:hypothetical protein
MNPGRACLALIQSEPDRSSAPGISNYLLDRLRYIGRRSSSLRIESVPALITVMSS